MNQGYVSLFSILEEVYSFEGYSHELDWGDAVSWTGKVLGLINAPALYHTKTTGQSALTPHISLSEYRGTLPIDFVEIIQNGVRDSISKELYTYSSLVNKNFGGPTYVIKDGYIETSNETGVMELAYTAFKIDEKGFPMIPDIERVKECIRSYITYRIDHKLWRSNKLDRSVYDESKTESLWYIGSAQNSLRILPPDRRHVWTRLWTQVLPTMMTNDINNAEQIKEDYSGYVKPAIIYPNLPSTPSN